MHALGIAVSALLFFGGCLGVLWGIRTTWREARASWRNWRDNQVVFRGLAIDTADNGKDTVVEYERLRNGVVRIVKEENYAQRS